MLSTQLRLGMARAIAVRVLLISLIVLCMCVSYVLRITRRVLFVSSFGHVDY